MAKDDYVLFPGKLAVDPSAETYHSLPKPNSDLRWAIHNLDAIGSELQQRKEIAGVMLTDEEWLQSDPGVAQLLGLMGKWLRLANSYVMTYAEGAE